MNKEFIPYKEAKILKKLGFDEPCFSVYYDTKEFKSYTGEWLDYNSKFNNKGIISAPLFQQAFKWFRDKHNLRSLIDTYAQDKENDFVSFYTIKSGNGYDKEPFFSGTFDTYEIAELACLKKLIEMSKEGYSIYMKHDSSITINKKK
jgi:hypothetical protein